MSDQLSPVQYEESVLNGFNGQNLVVSKKIENPYDDLLHSPLRVVQIFAATRRPQNKNLDGHFSCTSLKSGRQV